MNKSTVLTLATAAIVAGGCGSEPEFPETPPPTASVTAAPPPTNTVPTPPPQTGCDAVQSAAFSSIFQGRAATEAARMELEGGPVCGTATEGGTVSGTTFFLQPGMCYAVLANGLWTPRPWAYRPRWRRSQPRRSRSTPTRERWPGSERRPVTSGRGRGPAP